ncbi:MAG: HAMP domain-containing sensor histidine kinase, partial [Spongiibacteraceae bacterium]|nr:HAMP domain-containing sensor histidine kinase [Spongiibacteraceae bacterium]
PWTPADIEAAEELRRRLIEIDLAHQVLRERAAVQARDDLLAVVSHDLRSPLTAINLQASMMKRDLITQSPESTQRTRGAVDRIASASTRMSSLLNDLLDLSKIEAGRFRINPAPQDLARMLSDAHAVLSPLALEKGIVCSWNCPAGIVVHADEERLFQVVSNLISNAIKFTPEFGSIRIEGSRAAEYAEVRVIDSGEGVPADQQHHIFNRYWQARAGRTLGAGLGLHIAKGIVEAHRGTISVQSVRGQGSTFRFTLPLVEQ